MKNSNIDSAIMSTTKTQSENITSDEEDYKSNIPYNIENAPFTAATSATTAHDVAYETIGKEEEEENQNNNFNCQMWESDDGFMDDNLSALDVVDYNASSLNVSESLTNSFQAEFNNSNYFPLNNSITTAASKLINSSSSISSSSSALIEDNKINPTSSHSMYNADVEEDIKFSPNELVHPQPTPPTPPQPPSTLQYNYNIPLTSSHVNPMHPAPPPPPSFHHGHHPTLPPTQHGISNHNFVRPHPQTQPTHSQLQYEQYPHPSGYHHPNMWYPNAPYGTASAYYRSYGGQRYSNYDSYPHDPMLDMLQLSNSGREARNRAEKNRRDKLNGCIQELSTMVPHVAESQRRVDKTTILRCATHGLRLVYAFGKSQNQSRPQFTDSLMKLLDRFFIVITCHGEIVLVSSSVEQHLGHCQIDLYGQNILNITHPEDHNIMRQQLIPTDLDELFNTQTEDDSSDTKQRTKEEDEYIDRRLHADKRNFTVRLARAGPRSEPTSYEIVKIEGNFRRSDSAPRGKKVNTFPSTLQMIRRSRGRDDTIPLHTISGNDIVLIATARIIRLPTVIHSVFEPNAMKYKTRHLIDGRIIDCDQGIGLVAGYMTDEVQNLSPFTFMHQDDVRWVIVALRQMYDCKSSFGESTYRLITRNGHFIYLHSKGYLEIDKVTQQVRSFICVNTLLDEAEGKRRVQEMKNKFSLIVNTKIPQSSVDEPASNNPQQLEKAVLCLIQNLQKSPDAEDDDDDGNSSTGSYASEYTSPTCDPSTASTSAAATTAMHRSKNIASPPTLDSSIRAAAFHFARSVKTPPLALVPPEPASVKTSITKSVNVVNVTAAKHLRSNQQEKIIETHGCEMNSSQHSASNPLADAANDRCLCQGINAIIVQKQHCSHCQTTDESQNAYTARMPTATTIAATATATTGNKRSCDETVADQEMKITKRRLKSSEIEQVLSSSLDQLGKTLDKQLNAAIELRDKTNKYEVPNSDQRIEEIMEEHQMQSKIYVDIKSEYEVQTKQNKIIDAITTKDPTSPAVQLATTISPTELSGNNNSKNCND